MLDFSHHLLNKISVTIMLQLFIAGVSLSSLLNVFLYLPFNIENFTSYRVIVYPPTGALIIPFQCIKPSYTGTTWVNYAPISTTSELSSPNKYVDKTGALCIKSPLNPYY